MNERIRELADKVRFVDTIPYPDQDTIFQRFAELIIKECARIAEVNQAENMNWNIGEILKEHFGVE